MIKKNPRHERILRALARIEDLEILVRADKILRRRIPLLSKRDMARKIAERWAEFVSTYQAGDMIYKNSGGVTLGPGPQSGDGGVIHQIKNRGTIGVWIDSERGWIFLYPANIWRDRWTGDLPTTAGISEGFRQAMAGVGAVLNPILRAERLDMAKAASKKMDAEMTSDMKGK